MLLNLIVPLAFIFIITYFSILSIFENKIQGGIQSNLQQMVFSLDNEMNSLERVAQQLSFEGGINVKLEQYLTSTDYYEKYQLETSIRTNMELTRYMNPNVGFTEYYFSDTNQAAISQAQAKADFNPLQFPLLKKEGWFSYQGPHLSAVPQSSSQVLSIDRKIFLPSFKNHYLHIYVESGQNIVDTIFEQSRPNMNAAFVIIDDQNKIVYSESEHDFPLGIAYWNPEPGRSFHGIGSNYIFQEGTSLGWKLALVIPKSIYNDERNTWIGRYTLIVILSFCIAMLLAWVLWRSLYRSITGFSEHIVSLKHSDFHSPLKLPQIAEFDYLVQKFQQMRSTIWELLVEKEQVEKLKAQFEVERLLLQINPHFIHNTLDTIRWVARLNHQTEIDRLISTLNKILYYNMGGGTVTIREEIEALRDYCTLQQIRYDFVFDVNIQIDDKLLEVKIPRFVLQPLVENALYHGIGDDGTIEVKADLTEDKFILIEVIDNGRGMSEEEVYSLLHEPGKQRKVGLGIGIRYVFRMIKMQYGERAKLDIQSALDRGTSMRLFIPFERD
ncbi:sensor histidine kinase [Paenibacillus cymbidii]|uniref:sensor histidine kinase n=1 Tax=Paenibacillus cymbidii TaxID=1639034 RepID=UPI001436B29A|nr:histidine kinase [Paenibacillus cymbidii]